MLTLYIQEGCGYCTDVLATLDELALQASIKNIADQGVIAELVGRGGKEQVPFLVDDERGVAMYESGDIVTYLESHFSGTIPLQKQ